MKVCLIRQHAGLGDILFCLKIAKTMIDRGYHVIWPVISHYSFISEYIKIDKLAFVDETKNFPYKDIYIRNQPTPATENFLFLPIQIADRLYPRSPILGSKYELASISHDNWETYVDIIRNKEKEQALYYDILNLEDEEDYTLTSWIYGSPPNSKTLEGAKPKNKYDKMVDMRYVDGFNPFDWSLVLERASEIHMVDTCYICIMEALNTKVERPNMYSRRKYEDFLFQLKPYFNNSWNYLDIHVNK